MGKLRHKLVVRTEKGGVRLPPRAVLMLMIIGAAVVTTMSVTDKSKRKTDNDQGGNFGVNMVAPAKMNVVCVKRDLAPGDTIKPGDLGTKELIGGMPADALFEASDAVGRKVNTAMSAGDIVREHQLISAPTN